MDEKWEPYWHVFLGKSFGCHAVHERNRFVYFKFEASQIAFLIYKSQWALQLKLWGPCRDLAVAIGSQNTDDRWAARWL